MAVDRPRPAVASTLNEAAHDAGTPWTLGVVNGVDDIGQRHLLGVVLDGSLVGGEVDTRLVYAVGGL